jgi:hypothetical protein
VSVKLNAEQVTHRTHRVAQWSAIGLFLSLLIHAAVVNGDPTALFAVHMGVTFFVGSVTAIVWCTRHILRAQRKSRAKFVQELRKLDRRIVTPADVRQMMKDVFDEGQITGLATGLADLSRGAQARHSES